MGDTHLIQVGLLGRRILNLPAYCVIIVIKAWQKVISPLYGDNICRFAPSCSFYAISALETHGLIIGSYLTVRRILRCHPFNPGGIDPVPDKKVSPTKVSK